MTHGINILMYHQVGRFAPMREHRASYCRVDRFAAQMAWLARFGYRVLSMDEVVACIEGSSPIPPRAVALTFDDGYQNFHDEAWPILRRYGFPAIVYLVAGLVGKRADWVHDGPPLMAIETIRALRREGCHFGGHSTTHVKLAGLPAERVRREVAGCKAALEDLLGERVDHYCYPYGSHDLASVEAAAEAGWRSATTCARATATVADDPLTLPRKAVAYGDSLVGVLWKMHMKNVPKQPPIRRAAA